MTGAGAGKRRRDTKAASPRVYTIPAGEPFLARLAEGIRRAHGDGPFGLSDVTVLLPTRRATRALGDAFLEIQDDAPALLPRIRSIGDVDEDEIALAGDGLARAEFALPPAIAPLRRQLLLARMILAQWSAGGSGEAGDEMAPRPAQAARLAAELGRFLDEVQTERLSFDKLADIVPERFADHWQETLLFLEIVTEHWPDILAAEGAMDPAAHRNRLIEALTAEWRERPPGPVYAAGSTGSIPATADLLAAAARLEAGAVILPGLDLALDGESWDLIDPAHPQYGLKRLLEHLGVEREEVEIWPAAGAAGGAGRAAGPRVRLLSEAMRPADTTDAWAAARIDAPAAIGGMTLVNAPDPRAEAGIIALFLREALETPGRRAALVTPDRALARRVKAELGRWGIEIDDSAGGPLGDTPPGAFLALLARMAGEALAPVPLLAALKHPLAAAGLAPGRFRALVRRLERAILRGPRPGPGLAGLRDALGMAELEPRELREMAAFLDRIERALGPFPSALSAPGAELPAVLEAHIGAAEALAASDAETGAGRLWAAEAGEAAAIFVHELLAAAENMPAGQGAQYPALFEALLAGRVVRPRFSLHPRLSIWGPLEARLLAVDLVILGSLNEGTWPADPAGDPWMSRPMREAFGLPEPERRIGLQAHDFAQAAAFPEVVLTRAEKVNGAPSVTSRWLLRLEALLAGQGASLPVAAAGARAQWHRALDRPARIVPARPPRPAPPVAARPRSLSVTQIETLIRDPYAVYARHVLGLRPLDPLDADPGALERGTIVHEAMEAFIRDHMDRLPDDAEARFRALGREIFAARRSAPQVAAFWWPRFLNAARWFVTFERERRARARPIAIEVWGETAFEAPGGPFRLTGKADRIDRFREGGLAIIDYKTGAVPSANQVETFFAPQLSLEAALAFLGGFDGVPGEDVRELLYIRLKGGAPPGEAVPRGNDPMALGRDALAGLEKLIAEYDRAETPYLSRPRPQFERDRGDYDHLARVKAWSTIGTGEG